MGPPLKVGSCRGFESLPEGPEPHAVQSAGSKGEPGITAFPRLLGLGSKAIELHWVSRVSAKVYFPYKLGSSRLIFWAPPGAPADSMDAP